MNTAHECENAVVYTHKLLAISFILAQAPTQTKTGCTLRDPLPPPPPPLPIGAPTPLPWLTQKGRSLSLRSLISTEGKLVSVRRDRRHWQLATPELEQIFDNLIALVLVLRLENVLALLANDGELERVWGDAGYQRGLAMYACIHVCVCVCVCVCACVRACCVRERRGGCARRRSTHLSIVKRLDRLGLAERHLGHRAGGRAILERRLVRDAVRLGEKVARLPPDDGAEERNANPTLLPMWKRAGEERERPAASDRLQGRLMRRLGNPA